MLLLDSFKVKDNLRMCPWIVRRLLSKRSRDNQGLIVRVRSSLQVLTQNAADMPRFVFIFLRVSLRRLAPRYGRNLIEPPQIRREEFAPSFFLTSCPPRVWQGRIALTSEVIWHAIESLMW